QMSGTNLWNVKGRFLTKAGGILDSFLISDIPAFSPNPIVVAFGATNYLVAWSREVGPYIHLDYCRWGWPYTYYTNYWLMVHARLLSREGAVTTQEFQLTRSR